jgi:hypothetical protein
MSKCTEIIDCFNELSICVAFICRSLLTVVIFRERKGHILLLGGHTLKGGRGVQHGSAAQGFRISDEFQTGFAKKKKKKKKAGGYVGCDSDCTKHRPLTLAQGKKDFSI